MEIKDKPGLANVVVDYLSRLGPEATSSEELPIDDSFPNEQLLAISQHATLCYADLVNFKVCRFVRMYKVLMITNPSVVVVVPNKLSKQVLTAILNVLKIA